MPSNVCTPLFNGGDKPVTYRTSASVTGKTFAAVSGNIQSGPDITSTTLPTTFDGGNFQAATCGAGLKAAGVFAFDAASGAVVPVLKQGNIVPVTAGGAITAGAQVEVGSGGKAVTIASGIAVGIAHTTGVNNADCYIELY